MEFNKNISPRISILFDTAYATASSYLQRPLGVNHIPVKYFAIVA